jgi:hypothetical protein
LVIPEFDMRLVWILLVPGCAAATSPAQPPPSLPPVASASVAPPSGAEAPPVGAPPGHPSSSTEGPSPATPRLPALEVQSIGMHIGGGANDQKSKAPFVTAVERQFPAFLECFQLAAEPGRGGTFGVDLQIDKAGGAPRVEEPRTAIVGDAFRDCMLRAFSAVVFEPPGKALVISYSLRFSLGSK